MAILVSQRGQRVAFISLMAREYEESTAIVQRVLADRAGAKPDASCSKGEIDFRCMLLRVSRYDA